MGHRFGSVELKSICRVFQISSKTKGENISLRACVWEGADPQCRLEAQPILTLAVGKQAKIDHSWSLAQVAESE